MNANICCEQNWYDAQSRRQISRRPFVTTEIRVRCNLVVCSSTSALAWAIRLRSIADAVWHVWGKVHRPYRAHCLLSHWTRAPFSFVAASTPRRTRSNSLSISYLLQNAQTRNSFAVAENFFLAIFSQNLFATKLSHYSVRFFLWSSPSTRHRRAYTKTHLHCVTLAVINDKMVILVLLVSSGASSSPHKL